VAILAPTVLFLLMSLWSYMFRGHLLDGLRTLNPRRSEEFGRLVRSHYLQVYFAEAVVLFIVNGLILILELSQPVDGVVHLLLGITLSLTGLICGFMTERLDALHLSALLFLITLSISFGEFFFLAVTSTEIDTGIWILNYLSSPWPIFVVSSVLFFSLFAFFILIPEYNSVAQQE
jgi:hypothetical protein